VDKTLALVVVEGWRFRFCHRIGAAAKNWHQRKNTRVDEGGRAGRRRRRRRAGGVAVMVVQQATPGRPSAGGGVVVMDGVSLSIGACEKKREEKYHCKNFHGRED
jgi:hypothetical protein